MLVQGGEHLFVSVRTHMHLNVGQHDTSQGICNSDARVGIGSRVDDDPLSAILTGLMYAVDDCTLMVRLEAV